MGVFVRMMGPACEGTEQKTDMIDATYLKDASHVFEPAGEKGGPTISAGASSGARRVG